MFAYPKSLIFFTKMPDLSIVFTPFSAHIFASLRPWVHAKVTCVATDMKLRRQNTHCTYILWTLFYKIKLLNSILPSTFNYFSFYGKFKSNFPLKSFISLDVKSLTSIMSVYSQVMLIHCLNLFVNYFSFKFWVFFYFVRAFNYAEQHQHTHSPQFTKNWQPKWVLTWLAWKENG